MDKENCEVNTAKLDDRLGVFEKFIEDTVTDGLHAMVLALGYRVGIVEAFNRLSRPATVTEISQEAGLNLRYVQEWLNCMTAKGIVLYENETYSLPSSERVQKAVLTAAVLPMFADCLTNLESVMRDTERNRGYPFPQKDPEWLGKFNEVNAFDCVWLRRNLNPVFEKFQSDTQERVRTILDFGCGYGKLCQQLAQQYPDCSITGADLDRESVKHCKQTYRLPNLHFRRNTDLFSSNYKEKFDVIILMEVLHDLPNPGQVLTQLKSLLKLHGYIVTFDPNISSDVSANIGNEAAQTHLPYSVFFCLPNSMSTSPAVGHGAGWGVEERRRFIEDNGFTIITVDSQFMDKQFDRIIFKMLET
uniref:Uncharacterized protein LOC111105458 n=1 Tax=Crassostrea virginica TaxID=6565 RepID=A0A8B8AW22_CRAVI|nr:uncharacterized protein LOC111105458 [Crassostrea virginica]